MICLISFSTFWDVLPAFNCERAIGNIWSIFLELSILSPPSYVASNENIQLLKALRVNYRPS